MSDINLAVSAYFLGGFLSVFLPYFIAWLAQRVKFNWRYVVARLIAVVMIGLGGIIVPGFLDSLVEMGSSFDYPSLFFVTVMMTTYGSGQFGREVEKLGRVALGK